MTVSIDLTGRVALVTGAGQGIGRATALRLAEAGAIVAVADIVPERAQAVADDVTHAGSMGMAVPLDVTNARAVQEAVKRVEGSLGRVDILVNNAARWRVKLFKDIAPDEYQSEIDIILYGSLYCSRAVLDGMIEQRSGRIVNIISDAGRVGEPFLSVYSAAKAGLAGFTKSLAKEVGRYGITVNGVAPGTTETPGAEEFITRAGGVEALAKAYPLRRIGQPDDIANAVLFFASDLSGWVTGQILSVSGGYTMI